MAAAPGVFASTLFVCVGALYLSALPEPSLIPVLLSTMPLHCCRKLHDACHRWGIQTPKPHGSILFFGWKVYIVSSNSLLVTAEFSETLKRFAFRGEKCCYSETGWKVIFFVKN